MRPPQLPKPTSGFSKFKRFSFKAKPTMQQARFGYSGGGVSNINDNIELPYGGNPEFEPTPIPFNSDGQPSTIATSGGGDHGSNPDGFTPMYIGDWHDPVGNDGNAPGSGSIPVSGGGGGYTDNQIFNALGYNPSYPYGSSGSGVPTTNFLGTLGSILGLGGSLATGVPFLSKLGGIGGRMLGRSLADGPLGPGQPTQPQAPQQPSPSGSYNPFGGLPSGFNQVDQHFNNAEGNFGAPDFRFNGEQGPGWHGDSITSARGLPIVPGSGFLNNASGSGSMPTLGGGRSDYGADQALHSGRFASALQNMGYSGLKDFQNRTGFTLTGSRLGSGAGVGGALRPPTQAYAGGGVAQGEDDPEHTAQTTPEEMAELYAMIMRDNEQKRREAMNESPQRNRDIEPDLMQQIAAQPRGSTSISFAGGGMVPRVPKQQQIQGYGTDTVPAALTPGELILNKSQQAAVMPRPGMKSRLKPSELAAIEIAIRKKKGGQSGQSMRPAPMGAV